MGDPFFLKGVAMSNYSTKLRLERREELALRALTFATKTEDGQSFPSSDYAYVPDPDMPSTWKLRLTSTPGGDPDTSVVGAAIAALGEGFRGNKVEIPSTNLSQVKATVKAAWLKADPSRKEADVPSVIACGGMMDHEDDDDLDSNPVEGEDRTFLEALLPHHTAILDVITKTNFKDDNVAEFAANLAQKLVKGAAEIRNKLDATVPEVSTEEIPLPALGMKKYTYDLEIDDTEFGILPPFLKAGIIKGLKKKLAAESDPDKKTEIQAKIDKLNGGKKEEMAAKVDFLLDPSSIMQVEIDFSEDEFGTLPPFLKAGIIKGLEKKFTAEKDAKKKAEIQAKIDKLKA